MKGLRKAILFLFIIGFLSLPILGKKTYLGSFAPVNPEFKRYMERVRARDPSPLFTTKGYPLGFIPPPIDMTHAKGLIVLSKEERLLLPPLFDLRREGRLTPVRNQGNCSSCWAFASYASLESWLMGQGEVWDFSENNLKECHGFDPGGCEGGVHLFTIAYLTRGSGPIDEADDPYKDSDVGCITGLRPRKYLKTAIMCPDRRGPLDNDVIKDLVMKYGAMFTAMYYHDDYYNENDHTYYYNGTEDPNHAVAIVGWDDNKSISGAPNNGAWIVRNSWGTGWGEDGYFYVSYYDKRIGSHNCFFIDAVSPPSTIYQYDPLGKTGHYGFGNEIGWAANIFTPTSDGFITAIATYANQVNTTLNIRIYDTFRGGGFSNELATKSFTCTYPGYYTVELDSPVRLKKGDTFGVVIRYMTPGYNYPIPIERYVADFSSRAVANQRESYISEDGVSWMDITKISGNENTNVCIKAIVSGERLEEIKIKKTYNYPNPFILSEHKGTRISIEMSHPISTDGVSIEIYDIKGDLVHKVDKRDLRFTDSNITYLWDGRNDEGRKVGSGVYICWIRVEWDGKKDERFIKIVVIR